MGWLQDWFRLSETRPQADREAFERREAELKERLRRLERLAVEADVISRTDRPEEHHQ